MRHKNRRKHNKHFKLLLLKINSDFVTKFSSHKQYLFSLLQKQLFRGALSKRYSKICSKFTREHPCRSVISIKLLCNFIETTLRHGCSPENLLHIFRTPFTKNTSGWLLLLLSSRNAKKTYIDQSILCLKRNYSQTFNSRSYKKTFSSVYVTGTTSFDECFLSRATAS